MPVVPDIVLDPLQLEQLDLDLAHFNQQISVNLESANNSLIGEFTRSGKSAQPSYRKYRKGS